MFVFWKECRSTENKYSLIEILSPLFHCSAFMLTCALIPTVTVCVYFNLTKTTRALQDYYSIIVVI